VLYLAALSHPKFTQLIIYCHGSGSNLNNLYNFGTQLKTLYGISVLLYDYTGDGESTKTFTNYETDIKVVLSWVQHLGYDLSSIIICGYSIGSYSALLLPGPMGRILISPICGVIPFVEGTTLQYEG
jgi:pimeloyl-ACP methyl ester carboxylesterase